MKAKEIKNIINQIPDDAEVLFTYLDSHGALHTRDLKYTKEHLEKVGCHLFLTKSQKTSYEEEKVKLSTIAFNNWHRISKPKSSIK